LVEITDLLIKLLFLGEEFTRETAAPMPKTPRLPFTYSDLHVRLSMFFDIKIRGYTPDDSG
jgi:hypothetical protein